MNKKLIIIVLITVLNFSFYAQKLQLKKADYHFYNFEYAAAIKCYEKVMKKDSLNLHAIRHLAEAYRLTDSAQQSKQMYAQLIQSCDTVADDLYNYSRVLNSLGDYEESGLYHNKYAELIGSPDTQPVDMIAYIESLKKDSAWYLVNPVSINTKYAEFAPVKYKDKYLVFASSGQATNESLKKYQWNNQPFIDLYYAKIKSSHNLSNPKQFLEGVNTKFHEGPVCFSPDEKFMYFTRDNYLHRHKRLSDEGTLHLAIYKLTVKGKEKGEIVPIPINDQSYSIGHPAISADGSKMYFASNKEGGYGGTDLYFCEMFGDSLGTMKNCGPDINTPGDELFPYIHTDGTFYFASDGHPGIGGLDIFKCENKGGNLASPQNMGYPINTCHDDFSFCLDEEKINGYFASNRPGGKGDDDIYHIRLLKNEPAGIQGKVVDFNTNKALKGMKLFVENQNNDTITQLLVQQNGQFSFFIEPGQKYTLHANYFGASQSQEIDLSLKDSEKVLKDILISFKRPQMRYSGYVIDIETSKKLGDSKVFLKTSDNVVVDSCISKSNGYFEFLIDKPIDFMCAAQKSGYFGSAVKVSFVNAKEDEHIAKDVYLNKLEKDKSIEIKNIYYDYNMSTIRKDAGYELNRLVDLLKENPGMKIELRSHTDCRGNDFYNKRLSQARAKAAADYIVKSGIDKKRLSARGFGEDLLLNECKDGIDCTEEQHQENRRTEFRIIQL